MLRSARTVGFIALAAAMLAGLIAPPAGATSPPVGNEPLAVVGGVKVATEGGDITSDGRYVAFISDADDIVPGLAPAENNAYRLDRDTGTIEAVSLTPGGTLTGPNGVADPVISDDGRYVAFATKNADLGATDANADYDVYVRDLVSDTTTLVSHAAATTAGNGQSRKPRISPSGRYVAFESRADDLGPTDTNDGLDVYRWDRTDGSIVRVSSGFPDGHDADAGGSGGIPIDDGRVLFRGPIDFTPPNFVPAAYIRDPGVAGPPTPIPTPSGSTLVAASPAAVTADGRYVLLDVEQDGFDPRDANGTGDSYVLDLTTGTMELGLLGLKGKAPAGGSTPLDISGDGRYVLANTQDNTTAVRGNGKREPFLSDTATGITRRILTTAAGTPVTTSTPGVAMSADARTVLVAEGSSALFTGSVASPPVGDLRSFSAVVPTKLARDFPVQTDTAYVNRQYADFMGRAPTTAERNAALADIAGGELKEILPTELRRTTLHTTVVDPVTRLYLAYFLRAPDASGLDYWVAQRRAGRSLASISQFFAVSNEFKVRYGTLSNQEFIVRIYQNILGRAPDVSGESYWVSQLDSKAMNRGRVMVGFSESTEYRAKVAPEVDVAVDFASMLGRGATAGELAAYAADLRQGGYHYDVVGDLLESGEYPA